ncbi:MAG: hypothetical protein AB2792_19860 [Candidatus Thiodiazotropha sp.]
MGRSITSNINPGVKNPLSSDDSSNSNWAVTGATTFNTATEGSEVTVCQLTNGTIDFLEAHINGTGALSIDLRAVVDGVEYTKTISSASTSVYYYPMLRSATTNEVSGFQINFKTFDLYVTFNAATSLTQGTIQYRALTD